MDEGTLHLIAGDGPVVQVDDFDQLEKMMGIIKSSACSGTFIIKNEISPFLLVAYSWGINIISQC